MVNESFPTRFRYGIAHRGTRPRAADFIGSDCPELAVRRDGRPARVEPPPAVPFRKLPDWLDEDEVTVLRWLEQR